MTLETLLAEITKLERVKAIGMPDALFGARAMKMYPSDFAAAVDRVRITLLAAPCHVRKTEMTDGLVELLIQLIHKISVRAERKVESEINAEQPQEPGDCCSPELLAQRSKYTSARAISALQPPQRPPSSAQSPRRCHQPQGRRRCSASASGRVVTAARPAASTESSPSLHPPHQCRSAATLLDLGPC